MNKVPNWLYQEIKTVGILVSIFLLLFFAAPLAFAAWAPPTVVPPGGNVAAPVNIGPDAQIKEAGLWVGSLGTTGGATFGGNVGIGETAPLARLGVGIQGLVGDGIAVSVNSGQAALFARQQGAGVAGSFSGDVTVTGTLTVDSNATVGGQSVCREDGTNCPAAAVTYWTASGSDISNTNSGNIGIGTPNPSSTLTLDNPGQTDTALTLNVNDVVWHMGVPGDVGDFGYLHIGTGSAIGTNSYLRILPADIWGSFSFSPTIVEISSAHSTHQINGNGPPATRAFTLLNLTGENVTMFNATPIQFSALQAMLRIGQMTVSSVGGPQTMDKATGIAVPVPRVTGGTGNELTNASAVRILDGSASTQVLTNEYGIYIEDLTSAINNYAFVSEGDARVGIGYTAPNNKLHVRGRNTSDDSLDGGGVNTALGVYADDDAADIALYAQANNAGGYAGWFSGNTRITGTLTVDGNATVGGQSVCRADGTNCPAGTSLWTFSGSDISNTNSGNVGIGTAPSDKLEVAGYVRAYGLRTTVMTTGAEMVYIRGTGLNHNANRVVKIGNTTLINGAGRGLTLTILTAATHSLVSNTNYDTYGSTTASNNLATALNNVKRDQIGILTSHDAIESNITSNLRSAARRLGLFKLAGSPGGSRRPYAAIFYGSGTATGNTEAGRQAIEIFQPNDGDASYAIISTWLIEDGFTGQNLTNALVSGEPNTREPAVFVDASGRVGVGTVSPNRLLHVAGIAKLDGDLYVNSSSFDIAAENNPTRKLNIILNSNEVLLRGYGASDNTISLGAGGTTGLKVQSDGDIEIMNGNVGIGYAAPSNRLHIRGINTSDDGLDGGGVNTALGIYADDDAADVALYAQANNAGGWAGYFSGNVKIESGATSGDIFGVFGSVTTQGADWVQDVNAGWSARNNFTSVVYDNKIWIMGGWASGRKNDVWYSEDGATWTQATAAASWSARSDFTSVVYDNKIWIMGGYDGSFKNDVWYSEDGVTWTQAISSAPWSARFKHTSVVYDNKMWVIGGYGGGYKNDVWYSEDGVTWTQAISSAPWSARYSFTSVVYDNKIWIMGGWASGRKNDVWYSEDGATWTQATAAASWSARTSFTSVVYDNKIWIMGGYDGSFKNDVWYSVPIQNLRFAADGRVGIGATRLSSKLTVAGTIESTAGGIKFPDGTIQTSAAGSSAWALSGSDISNTNLGNVGIGILTPAARFAIDIVGSSGDGIAVSVNSGNSAIYAEQQGSGYAGYFSGNVKVQSGATFGDVFGAFGPITILGSEWDQDTTNANWTARSSHESVVYDNKIWVMGGWDVSRRNDVWYSEDGANWTEVTAIGPKWSARDSYAVVVYDNKIWVLGGYDGSYKNDVWYSEDGANWTEVTAIGPKWSARFLHSAVVYDNKIWVMGGWDVSRRNDVWYSEDGANWTEVTAIGPKWSARTSPAVVAHDNKMWVTGGRVSAGGYENDVWYSEDGANWTNASASGHWNGRRSHAAVVYDNKIWVMGGYDGLLKKNDVWYSEDGENWTQATSGALWSERFNHTAVVYGSKILIMGGDDGSRTNDVWHMTPVQSLRFAADGRVGIGTTKLSSKLTVAGTIESSAGGFKFPDGTVQTSAARVGSSAWTLSGGDISNTNLGNVGIGTLTPAARLAIDIVGSSGDGIAVSVNSDKSAIYAEQQGSGYAGYFSGNTKITGALDVSKIAISASSVNFYDPTTGTNRVFITDTGSIHQQIDDVTQSFPTIQTWFMESGSGGGTFFYDRSLAKFYFNINTHLTISSGGVTEVSAGSSLTESLILRSLFGGILLDPNNSSYVRVSGDFQVSGTKSAVVDTESFGKRTMYSFEEATPRFGDEGRATLKDGYAKVVLDPIFLETIEKPFFVHLTPYGPFMPYIDEIGDDYFIVRSIDKKDGEFFWMLTAPRKGFGDIRLEEVAADSKE